MFVIPSGIFLVNFLVVSPAVDASVRIQTSGTQYIQPTPNSNITLSYSVREMRIHKQYLYEFNFAFDIHKGVEPNFTSDTHSIIPLLFNRTQIYLTIKANYGLTFYTVFLLTNMTEFQVDNSQVEVQYELSSPQRFENLLVGLFHSSFSEDGGMYSSIGSGYYLFSKQNLIYVKDISNFSGDMYFWINENEYNLSYSLSSDFLEYSVNSSVGEIELKTASIYIGGSSFFYFPYVPNTSPGYYSHAINLTLYGYSQISFEFRIGISMLGAACVKYEVLSKSEVFGSLLKGLITSSIATLIGFIILLGCLVKDQNQAIIKTRARLRS